jgi:uncharacterized membrane protein YagU involved in acid resistance
MSPTPLRLGSRLLLGAIAGTVGTLAMTAAMSRLHQRLPAEERYPLTPREIVDAAAEKIAMPLSDEAALDLTTLGHFAYGAGAGAAIAAINPRIGVASGAGAGAAVWLISYMGWIPGVGLLKPATHHPHRRNLLMIGVHLVWGAATADALRELILARETMMAAGPDHDAAPPAGQST